MNTEIMQMFDYQGQQVRTVIIDGEPWFVAKDVCEVLEIGNITEAMKRLDQDEFSSTEVIDLVGRRQTAYIVNEAGLYSLILGSRKPEAKLFKRWITHEVIPSVRKTGSYSTQPLTPIQALQQTVALLAQQEQRLTAIEATTTVLGHRIDNLDLVNVEGDPRQRLVQMINRYALDNGIAYSLAHRRFDQAYNTAFRTNLTALRENYCRRHGLRVITRPDYLERIGRLEDAIRVADKMLNPRSIPTTYEGEVYAP